MTFSYKAAEYAYQKRNMIGLQSWRKKGKKAEYQAAALAEGISLSAFIEMCVDEKISKMMKE